MKRIFLLFAVIAMLFSSSVGAVEVSQKNNATIGITTVKSISDLGKNYNNVIDFVFSDIDGTLLPFDESKMPESVKVGIKKLKENNIPIILATGRSVFDGIELSRQVGVKTYIICQQGAEIVDYNNKLIHTDYISGLDATKMFKKINLFNSKNKTSVKVFFYTDGNAYAFEDFTPPFIGDKINIIKSVNDLRKGFGVAKIAMYSDNAEELKKIQSFMKKEFPNYHIDLSSYCYCDISSLTATKGNGIKKISELLNINLKNTAVFGDAENDISMFRLVKSNGGLAVAVGNALPIVKENASFTTDSVKNGGFEKAVNMIILNNKGLLVEK